MTSKLQQFRYVRFAPGTLREIAKKINEEFRQQVQKDVTSRNLPEVEIPADILVFNRMAVTVPDGNEGSEEWRYDDVDQFYPALKREYSMARYSMRQTFWTFLNLEVNLIQWTTLVQLEITGPTAEFIERIAALFEDAAPSSPWLTAAESEALKPRIFIGHGGSSTDWQTLLIDLDKVHGLPCEAFESGARSGHSIRDILSSMLDTNSFALLVFSGEDEQADGSFRARQNVVHEAGLFQGRLGFGRAIILREEGTDTFSNLDGVQHITYPKNRIKAAVGDVLAAINREFPRA